MVAEAVAVAKKALLLVLNVLIALKVASVDVVVAVASVDVVSFSSTSIS